MAKFRNIWVNESVAESSDILVLNIAEGSSRTNKDFSHFLSLARGSCFECVAILTIASNQRLITQKELSELYEQCLELFRMLSSLRTKVK